MLTNLYVRNIRCLDGLHYSFELLQHFQGSLYAVCCKIPDNNSNVVPALGYAWGFIDTLHRIREIARSLPRLSVKHPEVRHFLKATALAEEYRHYIQHLRNELSRDPPNTFPVWGSLSWIDESNNRRSYTVLLGSQIPGTQFSSCVYDRVKQAWVSRVCLSAAGTSFNFDHVYESVVRFREFILPWLTEALSGRVCVQGNLPILTVEISHHLAHDSGADLPK
jgi:hypothetical protein